MATKKKTVGEVLRKGIVLKGLRYETFLVEGAEATVEINGVQHCLVLNVEAFLDDPRGAVWMALNELRAALEEA